MNAEFKVLRVRSSMSKGLAVVYVNNKVLTSFDDTITLNGKYGQDVSGWASEIPDEVFIINAMKSHAEEIVKLMQ